MYPEDSFEFAPVEEEGCDPGGFLAGLLIGAALGAGLALLFAPKSGAALRSDIADAAADARNKVAEGYDDISHRTSERVEQTRDAMRTWVEHTKTALEETRHRLDEAVEAGRAAYDRKKTELDAQVDASLDA